jgi:redox-sensitive bicupin YhaK (pirin superfamily)
MITLRPADERGHFNHGWLDTFHTFSFADYHDPRHMGFRALRVINEDRVAPGQGFPPHGHRDMEIVTYILEGALEHKDSLGTGSVIRPGDVQRMSAGTGVRHSEFNHSPTEPVHLLQIWIEPAVRGIRPGYEQKTYPVDARRNTLCLVASPDGADDSVTIQQHAQLYASVLDTGRQVVHPLAVRRHAWVQVARGAIELNGLKLGQGDGAAVSNVPTLTIVASMPAELLVFDLA